MKTLTRTAVSLGLVFAITLAACSDDVDEATEKIQTAKALSDALLTVTDMPSGWEESQRQVFNTRSMENPSIDPSVWCSQAKATAEPLVDLAGQSGADVEMSQSRGGNAGASMMRLQAWSNDDATEYFATAQAAVEKCDNVSSTDESGVSTKTEVIDGRSVGNESVSFSQETIPPPSTQGEKFSSVSRTSIVRIGSIIMVMQLGDAGPTGSVQLMDEETWWGYVTQAVDKLEELNN